MPDDNIFNLKTMIMNAFEEKDIASILEKEPVDTKDIENKLKEKYQDILKDFSAKIEKIRNLEKMKSNLELDLKIKHPILYALSNYRKNNPKFFRITLIIGVILTIFSSYLIYHFTNGALILDNTSNNTSSEKSLFGDILYNITIILALSIIIITYVLIISNQVSHYKEAENSLNETSYSIENAIKNAQNEVYTNGILPEIRSLINIQLNPSYDNKLSISTTQGITGTFESKYEIPTSSKDKLTTLLNIMPNGSIGIAGPRGAGKSTLIYSFCSGWIEKFKNKNVLAVMTSAPVDYEPRDFLLHIFSSVCKKVLDLNGEQAQTYIGFSSDFQKSTFLPKNLFTTYGLVSVSLAIISLFFLREINISFRYDDPLVTFESSKSTFCFMISISLILLAYIFLIYPSFKNYIYKKNYRKRDEKEIFEQAKIIRQAKQNLQIIKFQSSFSSGWSGALSFPFGIKGGISSAATLSQNQLSLPEIVEKYRDFIELISFEYEIIVGIDELDKISSSDKAHRFLNEIKGIFNLKNCYYLISVSENAISSFNKRGMPFRDAFDSSFDDIIYVNHLDFKSSKELIRRRVIGMSVPFMCLCYLMSGGLARDLIRICRDLVEFHELYPKNDDISSLSKEIIKKDIMSKISAIKIDGKKSDSAENGSAQKMIEEIYQLERSIEIKSSLWTCCLNLMSAPEKLSISGYQDKDNESYEPNFLKVQIGTYLYYVLTVLDFFEIEHEMITFKRYEESHMFDKLAKAHYFIGICPRLAERIVTDFRIENGMVKDQPNQNQFTDINLAQQMI